jgi:hypothetical protein
MPECGGVWGSSSRAAWSACPPELLRPCVMRPSERGCGGSAWRCIWSLVAALLLDVRRRTERRCGDLLSDVAATSLRRCLLDAPAPAGALISAYTPNSPRLLLFKLYATQPQRNTGRACVVDGDALIEE